MYKRQGELSTSFWAAFPFFLPFLTMISSALLLEEESESELDPDEDSESEEKRIVFDVPTPLTNSITSTSVPDFVVEEDGSRVIAE